MFKLHLFLFDVGKSKTFDEINYEVLEKIKNGRVIADKCNIADLKFYSPKIVVVFSTHKPDIIQLSDYRWKIFKIYDNDLLDVTNPHVAMG